MSLAACNQHQEVSKAKKVLTFCFCGCIFAEILQVQNGVILTKHAHYSEYVGVMLDQLLFYANASH